MIECGNFAEVMIILLREKSKYSSVVEEIDDFVEKCIPYINMSGHCIDYERSQELYDEFRILFEKNY